MRRTGPLLALIGFLTLAPLCIHLWLERDRVEDLLAAAEAHAGEAPPTPEKHTEWTSTPPTACLPTRPPTSQERQDFAALRSEWAEAIRTADAVRVLRRMGELGGAEALAFVNERLEDDRDRVQYAAAEALGRMGGLAAAGLLEEQLVSEQARRPWLGAHGLGVMGDELATGVLIRSLEDRRVRPHRGAVLRALASMESDDGVAAVTQILYEGTRSDARLAAGALAQSSRGLEVLVEVARTDSPVDLRTAAIEAIRSHPSPAVDALIDGVLAEPSSRVRTAAVEALGYRESAAALPRLKTIVQSGTAAERQAAYRAYVKIDDDPAAAALVAGLRTCTRNERSSLVYSLGRMQAPKAVAELRRLILLGDPTISTSAASAAVHNHPELLLELDLADVIPGVRGYIFRALVNHRGLEALPTLQAAAEGPDVQLAEAALRAVAELPGEDARAVLITAALSTDARRARPALQALGGIDALPPIERQALLDRIAAADIAPDLLYAVSQTASPELTNALLSALRNGDRQTGNAAAYALGRLGAPGTAARLAELAADEQLGKQTRASVVRALGQLGSPEAAHVLRDLAREGDLTAIAAMRQIPGEGTVQLLTELAGAEDVAVAVGAVQALNGIQTPGATAALIEAATGEGDLARTAVYGLANRQDPAAREALLDIAWAGEPEKRIAALSAMGNRVDDAAATPVYRRALMDSEPRVVQSAISTLRYRPGPLASNLLLELAAREDASAAVRKQAAQALNHRGGAVARENAELLELVLGLNAAAAEQGPTSFTFEDMGGR